MKAIKFKDIIEQDKIRTTAVVGCVVVTKTGTATTKVVVPYGWGWTDENGDFLCNSDTPSLSYELVERKVPEIPEEIGTSIMLYRTDVVPCTLVKTEDDLWIGGSREWTTEVLMDRIEKHNGRVEILWTPGKAVK